jgi:hypothetical protein
MSELYYTPPSDEIFAEVKEKAMTLWSTMGDEPSYAEEKIGRIKDISNVSDNLMYMIAMFDHGNQIKLSLSLSNKACEAVRVRMIDGGTPEYLVVF